MNDKEKILEWFENVMTPHCPNCNAELESYPFYDWQGAFRICKNCGEKVRENKFNRKKDTR